MFIGNCGKVMKTASAGQVAEGAFQELSNSRAALINKDLCRLSELNKTWQVNKVDFPRDIAESNPHFFPQRAAKRENFFWPQCNPFNPRPSQRMVPHSFVFFPAKGWVSLPCCRSLGCGCRLSRGSRNARLHVVGLNHRLGNVNGRIDIQNRRVVQ